MPSRGGRIRTSKLLDIVETFIQDIACCPETAKVSNLGHANYRVWPWSFFELHPEDFSRPYLNSKPALVLRSSLLSPFVAPSIRWCRRRESRGGVKLDVDNLFRSIFGNELSWYLILDIWYLKILAQFVSESLHLSMFVRAKKELEHFSYYTPKANNCQ